MSGSLCLVLNQLVVSTHLSSHAQGNRRMEALFPPLLLSGNLPESVDLKVQPRGGGGVGSNILSSPSVCFLTHGAYCRDRAAPSWAEGDHHGPACTVPSPQGPRWQALCVSAKLCKNCLPSRVPRSDSDRWICENLWNGSKCILQSSAHSATLGCKRTHLLKKVLPSPASLPMCSLVKSKGADHCLSRPVCTCCPC